MEVFDTNLNLVEVSYIGDDSYEVVNDIVLVNGRSLARAMEEIEHFYGETIMSAKIYPLEEGPLCLTPEIAGAIKEEEGLA